MTEYNRSATDRNPPSLFSHDPIKEKKEARKKLLETVFKRRAEHTRRWYTKMQLNVREELDRIS